MTSSRGTAHTFRWMAVCKDCRRRGAPGAFGYPDRWIGDVTERGGTRSDRCPECRRTHTRDARIAATPYIDVQTIARVADPTNPTGPLGGLGPLPMEHERVGGQADFSRFDFGLTDEHVLKLLTGLVDKQTAVVVSGTGSGKTTFLPTRLLFPPPEASLELAARGPIIVTEPRRAAAVDTAAFVGLQLLGTGVGAGCDVGYRVKDVAAFDASCRLIYVTDGSLVNWLCDGSLDRFGAIIIDEAHERSKNIDFILGYLRDALPRYPHLRLIIASATIDPEFFVEYFGGPSSVVRLDIPAQKTWGYGVPLWPIEEVDLSHPDWQRPGPDGENLVEVTRGLGQLRIVREPIEPGPSWQTWRDKMPVLVAEQVLTLLRGTGGGDILAFLPGENAIARAVALIRAGVAESVDVYSLLRTSPEEVQRRARGEKLDPSRRRVIVATNIAETSLTIDGITFVVDSGLINQSRWDTETETKSVPTVPHSQDGVRQRWGRVGRKAPGWVFPLYTRGQFERVLPEHTPPEATRDDLASFVLTARRAGIDRPEQFRWPTSSSCADSRLRTAATFQTEILRADRELLARGAIKSDGTLTPLGEELQAFSGSLAHATAVALADQLSCALEVATAMSLLSRPRLVGSLLSFDVRWDAHTRNAARRRHEATAAGCVDDLDLVLKIYAAWERAENPQAWAREHWVNHAELLAASEMRREALDALCPGKKSDEIRSILTELAPRARAVLAQALQNAVYENIDGAWRLRSRQQDAVSRIDTLTRCGDAEEVIALRKGRSQGLTILSNIVRVPVLSACTSWLDLAILVAERLRTPTGELQGPTFDDHWALTQAWGLGGRHHCRTSDGSSGLRVCAAGLAPMPVLAMPEAPIGTEESDGDLAPLNDCAVIDAAKEAEFADLADLEAPDVEAGELNDRAFDVSRTNVPEAPQIVLVGPGSLNNETVVRVVGYTGVGLERRLQVVVEGSVARAEAPSACIVGMNSVVRVVELVKEWGAPFLVAVDENTGFEVAIEASDLTFQPRDREIVAAVPIGARFEVTVTATDHDTGTLRVSRLPQVHRDLAKVLTVEPNADHFGVLPAIVTGTDDSGRTVITLDHGDPATGLLHRICLDAAQLRETGISQSPGTSVILGLRPAEPLRCRLVESPNRLAELCAETPELRWDDAGGVLMVLRPPLPLEIRNRLLAASRADEWTQKVDGLWRRSHVLKVTSAKRTPPSPGTHAVRPIAPGDRISGTVSKVVGHLGVLVRLPDRREGLVRSSRIGAGLLNPTSYFSCSDNVEVIVTAVRAVDGAARIELAMPGLSVPPLQEQLEDLRREGTQIRGTVTNLVRHGAFVALGLGIMGLIRSARLSRPLSKGDRVQVRIVGVRVQSGSPLVDLELRGL